MTASAMKEFGKFDVSILRYVISTKHFLVIDYLKTPICITIASLVYIL